MKKKIRLSQLTNEYLKTNSAWETIVETIDEEDVQLTPVEFDQKGRIPIHLGEVWCLCRAIFANETEYIASAMCRGDSSDGPLLWSVWNGSEDVRLMLPPAPSFVLEKEGPECFANKFNLSIKDVFPILFEVIPRFESAPEIRRIKLGFSGELNNLEKDD
jgi:hypothetical protein